MNALATVWVWLCVAVVALPLKPCAFLSSACCPAKQVAFHVAEAPRSCCAEHSESNHKPSQKHDEPCSRDCCKLSPFVKTSDTLVAVAQVDAVLPAILSLDGAPVAHLAVAGEVLPPDVPLHLLHCQWRL